MAQEDADAVQHAKFTGRQVSREVTDAMTDDEKEHAAFIHANDPKTMHTGGRVPRTGRVNLQAGERVNGRTVDGGEEILHQGDVVDARRFPVRHPEGDKVPKNFVHGIPPVSGRVTRAFLSANPHLDPRNR